MELNNMTTVELRVLKKEIEDELSKRHWEKENNKRSCSTCEYCIYDRNAHPTWKFNAGGHKCMAWSDRGKLLPSSPRNGRKTAPSWCPIGQKIEQLLI